MKKKYSIAVLLFFALISLPLAEDVVKIGVCGPHTGPYASFGEQEWRGTVKAAEAINAKGGINGKKIVLIKGDDACEPKQAIAVANKLIDQDGVAAVVGHFCSSSTIPASNVYDEAGILMVTPASTNSAVTDRNLPYVLRAIFRDDEQGKVAGDFLVKTLKVKKIAVIHDKDTYGQGLADAVRNRINALGVSDILYEGLTRGEKDFNALVTKLRSVGADAVYFGGLHQEAGVLVKQMREQGLKIPFVSGDGIVSQDFVNTVGGANNTKGVYMTFTTDPESLSSSKKIVAQFKEEGYKPEGFTLYSYAALEIIAAGLSKGNFDTDKAVAYLKSNTINTVLGKTSFDEKGDIQGVGFQVYKWIGSEYKPY